MTENNNINQDNNSKLHGWVPFLLVFGGIVAVLVVVKLVLYLLG